jgi:hypothetical protein
MKLITILLLLLNFLFTPITTANAISLSDNIYQQRKNPSSDSIGKYCMGREIAKVRKEMQAVGLVWRETKNLLPRQHLMVFEKEPF